MWVLTPSLSLGIAVLCGQPPAILQGTVEGTDFRWGASISYRCAPGFQLSHPAILSCEGHGVWRGDPPQCLRECPGRSMGWQGGRVAGRIGAFLKAGRSANCSPHQLCSAETPAPQPRDGSAGRPSPTKPRFPSSARRPFFWWALPVGAAGPMAPGVVSSQSALVGSPARGSPASCQCAGV